MAMYPPRGMYIKWYTIFQPNVHSILGRHATAANLDGTVSPHNSVSGASSKNMAWLLHYGHYVALHDPEANFHSY